MSVSFPSSVLNVLLRALLGSNAKAIAAEEKELQSEKKRQQRSLLDSMAASTLATVTDKSEEVHDATVGSSTGGADIPFSERAQSFISYYHPASSSSADSSTHSSFLSLLNYFSADSTPASSSSASLTEGSDSFPFELKESDACSSSSSAASPSFADRFRHILRLAYNSRKLFDGETCDLIIEHFVQEEDLDLAFHALRFIKKEARIRNGERPAFFVMSPCASSFLLLRFQIHVYFPASLFSSFCLIFVAQKERGLKPAL